MRESISQQLGYVAGMYNITFLAFTVQSIAISIAHFTELRASLTLAISMETFVEKYFNTFSFPDNICYSA